MCYAKDEGGQRCFGHASTAYDKARGAVQADPDSDAAWERLVGAEIDFASTPQGADLLREDVARFKEAGVEPDIIVAKENTIRRGAEIRERNAAVRDAVRAAKGKPKVAPGDPDVAYEQEQAARAKRRAAGGVTSVSDRVFDAVSDPAYLARQMGIPVPSAAGRGVPMHERLRAAADREDKQRRAEKMHASAAAWRPTRLALSQPGEARNAMEDAYQHLQRQYPEFTERPYHYMEKALRDPDPTEDATVSAYRAAVTPHITPEVMRDAVMQSRAISVLQYHSGNDAAPEVFACQRLKYDHDPATPAEIRSAALGVASLLEHSPTLSREDQIRWAQDLVRDLSGHEVRIARNPLVHNIASVDRKYRYRVSVLS